jgi:hypothetical protein
MPVESSPSTTLYTLGKGVVSIAEYDDNGTLGEYSDMGNAPAFSFELNEEKLEHYSSRSGAKRKDKEVTIQVGYMLTFTLDEFSVSNLVKFLRGTLVGSYQITALTNLSKEYAIRFTSANAAGPNQIWNFHKCTLKPNGALNLISDEWDAMEFTGEGLDDTTNHATSPYFTVDYQTTTTTTTTSSTTTTTSSTTTTTAPV